MGSAIWLFLKPLCCFVCKGYIYLSTLVSASLLFIMPRAPTPPENPLCLFVDPHGLGWPLAVSESCFCMIAKLTLLAARKSLMEIISPDILRPSVSLSFNASVSMDMLRTRVRTWAGMTAFLRGRRDLPGQWRHGIWSFFRSQLSTCLITIEMTLNSE